MKQTYRAACSPIPATSTNSLNNLYAQIGHTLWTDRTQTLAVTPKLNQHNSMF